MTRTGNPLMAETCTYTFAGSATPTGPRPAGPRSPPASCAHQLRNSGRVTGSLAATEQRHGPEPRVRRALQAWLPARLDAAADATLAEHVAAFVAAGGRPVSLSAMSRAIGGLPPEPGAERIPGGRRRRAGRPLKQQA